jgi:putative ABC transport system permease protein
MLLNYFKIAFRNLTRNKVYSLINILGLSLGIGCCMLLALYIQDELSYDQHHSRLNDLYRIVTIFETDKGINKMKTTSPPIALTMRDEISEIENAARALNPPGVSRSLIKYEDKLFYETDGLIADSSLFDVLTYDFIQGNSEKALVDANTVVISDELAQKLFGNDIALDKVISISQGGAPDNFKVTGVFRKNHKSHFKANFFISMMTSSGLANYIRTNPEANEQWSGQNFVPAYVKLRAGANLAEVVRKMNEVLLKYGADDIKAQGRKKSLDLELVKDIYLRSDIGQSPRISYLYVIGSIAAFILLIACINFMNLSTAKATKRASEIGIRKVMGAVRSSLISQILGEAMVIVMISILLSIVLVQAGLPLFNNLTGKTIGYDTENVMFFVLALLIVAVVTGLVAGSYPAFYLSSFQPAQTLKGKFTMSNSSGWLRRSLVVFQFMIAITLVCGMLIISKQLNFMQGTNLGFDAQAKIVLPLRTSTAINSYASLEKEIAKTSAVNRVSGANYMPGSWIWSDSFFYPDGGRMETALLIRRNTVDEGYIELMGIQLLAGRTFSDNRAVDSNDKVIINRLAATGLGFTPEQAIGRNIYNEYEGKRYPSEIIGVMEDYHQTSLKDAIMPVLFRMNSEPKYDYLIADVNTNNFESTIADLRTKWASLIGDTPFEYSFLDDDIAHQYDEDKRVSRIITSFTLIAMLISCLGLYGLSSYMAERRFKEIGIRKVMGAHVSQIVTMMSMEFVKLVIVAFAISVPLAWYGMNQWLEGFAYRIEVDPLLFLVAGLAALFVALLTVSFESLKAALHNPVDALRNE